MIKLDPQYITEVRTVSGGETVASVTTDTLNLIQFAADFRTGTFYATIQRGTVVNGEFTENLPSYVVTVHADGSLTVNNGHTATLPGMDAFVAALKTQLDQFMLASGLITGTAQ